MASQTLFDKLQMTFRNRNFFGLLRYLIPKRLDIPNLLSFRKLIKSDRHLY